MMRAKRTTYAARVADDEVAKLSRDIKQLIQHLQEGNRKKNKLVDKYAKLIQGPKREYQSVIAKKKQLTKFLKKQEEENQKIKYEKQIKERPKKMELYSKMLAMQNRRQKRKKCYKYESDSSDYEDSVEDDVCKKRKKNRSTRKNNIHNINGTKNYYDDHNDHDVADNYLSEESEVEEKPKKKKEKKERYRDIYKTLNLVNLSILK